MKKLLFLFSILLTIKATAATRTFFISPTGNDANTASQAQNPATPWRTLGLHTASLVAGDIVRYQCGGTYFDSLDIKAANATLTYYGTGAQPIITGLYTVTTWTNLGNGIYESEALPTINGCNMVAINNKSYALGRFPNSGTSNDGYLTFESHSGTASITDNQKPAAIDASYAGAQVVMRVTHYQTARATITGVSGNTISFSSFSALDGGSLSDNYGYFIQNSLKTLDVFGEWFYNPSTKKLDVFFGAAGPVGNTVQVAVKNKLMYNHASNVSVIGLTLSGADYGIVNDGTFSNLTVDSCNLQLFSYSAMTLANMKNTTITNSTFRYANLNGVVWNFNDSGITVRNCKMYNMTPHVGMFIKDPTNSMYGIGLSMGSSDGILVDGNEFHNMGYVSVRFNESNNVFIQNNKVDSFLTTLDDAGAYYTWRSSNNAKVIHDRYILNNIATNCLATGFGTPAQDGVWGANYYCDDNSYNVVLSGNTGANGTENGIYLHNAHDITVTNNNFYNNDESQIEIADDGSGGVVSALTIRNNQVVAKTTGQLLVNLRSSNNNFNTFFTYIDSNYYGRTSNDNGAFVRNWFNNPVQTFAFSGWQTNIGAEAKSKRTLISDPAKIIFTINNNNVSKRLSFCAACLGLDYTSYTKKAIVNSGSSLILLKP